MVHLATVLVATSAMLMPRTEVEGKPEVKIMIMTMTMRWKKPRQGWTLRRRRSTMATNIINMQEGSRRSSV